MSLAFSPDDRVLLAGVYNGRAYLWDLTTHEPIGKPMEHGDWVRAVAFTADGRHAVTACWDTRVRFWDANTGCRPVLPTVTNDSHSWHWR